MGFQEKLEQPKTKENIFQQAKSLLEGVTKNIENLNKRLEYGNLRHDLQNLDMKTLDLFIENGETDNDDEEEHDDVSKSEKALAEEIGKLSAQISKVVAFERDVLKLKKDSEDVTHAKGTLELITEE